MAPANPTPRTPTREKLLQAAVDVIAADGVQAVTHRSVEEAAGVARGSTRYYFHTREELLAAVVEHMAAVDAAVLADAAALVEGGSLDPGVMSDAVQSDAMRAMSQMFLADPARSAARFEVYLYAARRPELRETVARWRQTFIDLGAAHLRARGAQHPEVASRLTVAAMDGLILHALTTPHVDYLAHGPSWMDLLAQVAVGFSGEHDTHAGDVPPRRRR